jgi:RNA polymerase sigma-70 factor (ECF subfamily)
MSPDDRDQHSDDSRLVEQAASGDERAMGALLSLYRTRLRRMVDLRMAPGLRSRLDPSDVLQEALLEAAQRFPEYAREKPLPFFLWLRRITRDRLISLHRRHLGAKARDPRREVPLHSGDADATTEGLAAQLLGQITSPSLQLARAEASLRLQEALNTLDPHEREVLSLRHFEQLSNSEVAHELGLSESAASKRYLRAVLRLRGILETMNLPLESFLPWRNR